MPMDAPTMDVLRKQAIAMAMLWLTARDYEHEGGRAWFHVRASDLGLRDGVLPGKRIRVTIEAQTDDSGVDVPAAIASSTSDAGGKNDHAPAVPTVSPARTAVLAELERWRAANRHRAELEQELAHLRAAGVSVLAQPQQENDRG